MAYDEMGAKLQTSNSLVEYARQIVRRTSLPASLPGNVVVQLAKRLASVASPTDAPLPCTSLGVNRPIEAALFRYAVQAAGNDDAAMAFFDPPSTTAARSPEAKWFDALVNLHVRTSNAVARSTRSAIDSLLVEAMDLQEEIQPDHATSQPWGLNAMLLRPDTAPTAEMMLHAAESAGFEPVALLLIADAVYCADRYRTL